MIRLLKTALVLFLGIAALVFAVTNMHDVEIHLDPLGLGVETLRSLQVPMAFVILSAVAVGLIIGVVLMRLVARPIYSDNRRQRREVERLRGEVSRLQESLRAADGGVRMPAALPAPRR